jgi:hypothetical protein
MTRRWIGPVGLKCVCLLMLLVFLWLCLGYSARNSHFYGDDLVNNYLAYRLPFWSSLLTPIDVHVVPMHRLVNYLLTHIEPYDFRLALGVLAVCYLAGFHLLLKVLDQLLDSPWNPLVALVFWCNGLVLHQFMWWSSGLHRLPYILLALLAIHAYLRYRQDGGWKPMLLCTLSITAALGFYAKAILIPGYLLAIELCLSWRQGLAVARRYIPGLVLVVLSAAYVAWYELFSPALRMAQASDPWLAVKIASAFLRETFPESFGARYTDGIATWLACLAWAVLLAYSLLRARSRAVVWLVLIAVLYANYLVITGPARGQFFGTALATVMRYYFELGFLLAIFLTLALAPERAVSTPPIAAFALAISLSVAFPLYGYHQARAEIAATYGKEFKKNHRFIKSLSQALAKLPDDRPLRFVDSNVPPYVYGAFLNIGLPYSKVVSVLKPNVEFVERNRARYEFGPEGQILDVAH